MRPYTYPDARFNPVEDALPPNLRPNVRRRILAETDTRRQGRMVALVRRHPGATLAELNEATSGERQRRTPTLDETEFAWSLDLRDIEGIAPWIEHVLIKHRAKIIGTRERLDPPQPVFEYRFRGVVQTRIRLDHPAALWRWLVGINDWRRATHARLESYTFDRAYEAATAWHDTFLAYAGGGGYDDTDPANVVFRWPDDWTLQHVVTHHDFVEEGNRMGHCVSTYWDTDQDVDPASTIYSLRDPMNLPHATIEAMRLPHGEWVVQQVQGRASGPLKAAYAIRLRTFFETQKAYQHIRVPITYHSTETSLRQSIDDGGEQFPTRGLGLESLLSLPLSPDWPKDRKAFNYVVEKAFEHDFVLRTTHKVPSGSTEFDSLACMGSNYDIIGRTSSSTARLLYLRLARAAGIAGVPSIY